MPNDCDFEMKIRGSKQAIKRVVDCLQADYHYNEGKPSHKHFFRVFDTYEDKLINNGDGTFTQWLHGYCAWSVYSCMCNGTHTYYNDVKKDYPDIFMGTTLEEQSQDCEIEVFSEETGMGFSEHYLYKNGYCEVDDCAQIEVECDDEEYTILNPHRYDQGEDYMWTL